MNVVMQIMFRLLQPSKITSKVKLDILSVLEVAPMFNFH